MKDKGNEFELPIVNLNTECCVYYYEPEPF